MPEFRIIENDEEGDDQFSPSVMNETWDLSNTVYLELLTRQRKLEDARAKALNEIRHKRSLIQRLIDNLVPS
jgi:hypothetical protein